MKRWHWITIGILAIATLIVEFTLVHHHGKHWWNEIPGFYILWGFIGTVAVVYISKILGNILVLREEEYYDHN